MGTDASHFISVMAAFRFRSYMAGMLSSRIHDVLAHDCYHLSSDYSAFSVVIDGSIAFFVK